jgi:hypothetical protein
VIIYKGSEFVIEFIEHLQNVTTNNDSLTQLQIPKIQFQTAAYIKSFQFPMSSPVIS